MNFGGPILGGIEGYTNWCIKEMLNQGHSVSLIAPDNTNLNGEFNDYETSGKFSIFRLPTKSSEFTGGELNVEKYISLIKSLKVSDYDFIYNNFQHNKLLRYLNSIHDKVKVIHYSHAIPNNYNFGILRKYTNLYLMHCGIVNKLAWGEIAGKYNPLATDFEKFIDTTETLGDWKWDNTVTVISRLTRDKGILDVISMAVSNPNVQFNVYGSRVELDDIFTFTLNKVKYTSKDRPFYELFDEISKNIPNLTWVNRDQNPTRKELYDTLKNSGTVILSLSPAEAGATIGMEARALGLPVITFDYELSEVKNYIRPNQDLSVFESEFGIIGNSNSFSPHISVSLLNRLSKLTFNRDCIRRGLYTQSDHVKSIIDYVVSIGN